MDCWGLGVVRIRGGDLERGQISGLKFSVYVEQAVEALAEQSGASEQDDGDGELQRHKVGAEAFPCGAGGAASAFGEVFAEVRRGEAQGSV